MNKKQVSRSLWSSFCLLVLLASFSISTFAHHNAVGLWDAKKSQTITGTVKEFLYVNPHAGIVVDVVMPDGKHEEWRTLMGNIRQLSNIGWSRHTLKAGDKITIFGYPYLNGEKVIFGQSVTTIADGKVYPVHSDVLKNNTLNPGTFPGQEDFKVEGDAKPSSKGKTQR